MVGPRPLVHAAETPQDAGTWSNWRRRLLVTLVVILIYRIGCRIPLPGLSMTTLSEISDAPQLALASERLSLFALGVMPLFNALLLLELARLVPYLRRGLDPHNDRMSSWLKGLTVALAVLQATGYAHALEEVPTLVAESGAAFRLTTVMTLVAASLLALWLADTVTRQGLGSGVWILFAVGLLPDIAAGARSIVAHTSHGAADVSSVVLAGAALVGTAVMIVRLVIAADYKALDVIVWPPILASTIVAWSLGGLYLLLGTIDAGASGTSMMEPGHPVRILLLGTVTWLIAAQRRPLPGATNLAATSPRTTAAVLAGTVVVLEILLGYSRVPLPIAFTTTSWIILVTLAASLAGGALKAAGR